MTTPLTPRPDPPVVKGVLRPGRTVYLVDICCPYCHLQHVHGAGRSGRQLGHRVSHCAPKDRVAWDRGYIIEADPPPTDDRERRFNRLYLQRRRKQLRYLSRFRNVEEAART